MSEAVNPEVFAALWEMTKGPRLNTDALNSYIIDTKILNQIGPWKELKRYYPIASGGVDNRSALEGYLEEYFLGVQPELSEDELDELTNDRLRQIDEGSPLTEGEEESQWEALDYLSTLTLYSVEHEGRTIYWAGEFEPSGMGHFYARSYGPFRSLDDAESIANAMDWPDPDVENLS